LRFSRRVRLLTRERDIEALQLLPHSHSKVLVDVKADVRPKADELGQILVL
jgi:hypothetical protein